jgi:formylglycine-generating enzyme required for sulfatase activity
LVVLLISYGTQYRAAVTADDEVPVAGKTITIQIPGLPAGAKPLEMVLIPAGTFTMGSPSNEKDRDSDEGPQHRVTISKDFYIGKYEVTQAQWKAVMGSNPSARKGDNLPVEQVSWDDCQAFIQKLNSMALGVGTFRLPTEAEWEYACRAGTTTRLYWGDDPNYSQIGGYGWYWANSAGRNHPVGEKLPNAWGLFDMSGNVWEWCQDWYGPYPSGAQVDPTGPQSGLYRVWRGGGRGDGAVYFRSARRLGDYHDSWYSSVGCRVVLAPGTP